MQSRILFYFLLCLEIISFAPKAYSAASDSCESLLSCIQLISMVQTNKESEYSRLEASFNTLVEAGVGAASDSMKPRCNLRGNGDPFCSHFDPTMPFDQTVLLFSHVPHDLVTRMCTKLLDAGHSVTGKILMEYSLYINGNPAVFLPVFYRMLDNAFGLFRTDNLSFPNELQQLIKKLLYQHHHNPFNLEIIKTTVHPI